MAEQRAPEIAEPRLNPVEVAFLREQLRELPEEFLLDEFDSFTVSSEEEPTGEVEIVPLSELDVDKQLQLRKQLQQLAEEAEEEEEKEEEERFVAVEEQQAKFRQEAQNDLQKQIVAEAQRRKVRIQEDILAFEQQQEERRKKESQNDLQKQIVAEARRRKVRTQEDILAFEQQQQERRKKESINRDTPLFENNILLQRRRELEQQQNDNILDFLDEDELRQQEEQKYIETLKRIKEDEEVLIEQQRQLEERRLQQRASQIFETQEAREAKELAQLEREARERGIQEEEYTGPGHIQEQHKPYLQELRVELSNEEEALNAGAQPNYVELVNDHGMRSQVQYRTFLITEIALILRGHNPSREDSVRFLGPLQ